MEKVEVRYRLSERELTSLFFLEYYRARGKVFWSIWRLVGGPVLIALSTFFRREDMWLRSGDSWPAWLPAVEFSYASVLVAAGVYFMLRPFVQALLGYFVREQLHEAKRNVYLTVEDQGLTLRNGDGVTSQVPWSAVTNFGTLTRMCWFEFADGLRIFVPRQLLEPHQTFVTRLLGEHGLTH